MGFAYKLVGIPRNTSTKRKTTAYFPIKHIALASTKASLLKCYLSFDGRNIGEIDYSEYDLKKLREFESALPYCWLWAVKILFYFLSKKILFYTGFSSEIISFYFLIFWKILSSLHNFSAKIFIFLWGKKSLHYYSPIKKISFLIIS